MKKLKALLLSLTLGLTAVGCALPASDVKAETSATTEMAGVTMYRLYNPNSGEHFYTGNETEKTNLVKAGWSDEGIGWIAPVTSDTPVYRLYNGNVGDHHYTLDAKEKDSLIKAGWKDEGIGWYSDREMTVLVYREYNPNAVTGTHNYTTSKKEHDMLVKAGWIDEGIGWCAIAGNDDPEEPTEPEYPSEPLFPNAKIGDYVTFGTYEQDGNLGNGSEPIEWQYVGNRDGHKYLLSKYALDAQQYNRAEEAVTWENCTLRKWLNEDFYDKAFSDADKKKIVTAHNENPDSYELYSWGSEIHGAEGGNATDDNVFLMSWTEAMDYLDGEVWIYGLKAENYNQKLLCRPTACADNLGTMYLYDGNWFYDGSDGGYPSDVIGCCHWPLRSPGYLQDRYTEVGYDGSLYSYIYDGVNARSFIRPAILID